MSARLPAASDESSYRMWVDERVRFADLDLMGHVNNKAYMTYAESGRVGFLLKTGMWVQGAARQNVVARQEIDYLNELHFPAEIRIGVRVLAIGRSSYTIGLGIFGPRGCVASVVTVMVRIDAATHAKLALDDEEKARLQPWLATA